jgi:hypothetical protein
MPGSDISLDCLYSSSIYISSLLIYLSCVDVLTVDDTLDNVHDEMFGSLYDVKDPYLNHMSIYHVVYHIVNHTN